MRAHLVAAALVFGLTVAPRPAEALKQVRYPEVKVDLAEASQPEPALASALKALNEAVARKDAAALFGLVGPTFVWTLQSEMADQFDLGRDALTNFKVAFGFRPPGKDADGPVENGPFWDALADILKDSEVDRPNPAANLVCLPRAATVSDEAVFDKARAAVETDDQQADWYYLAPDTAVTKAATDGGAPLAKLGRTAVPVLDAYPPAPQGQPAPAVTRFKILLPSGQTGWVAAASAKPLFRDRLCLAKTQSGEWRMASYDQNQ